MAQGTAGARFGCMVRERWGRQAQTWAAAWAMWCRACGLLGVRYAAATGRRKRQLEVEAATELWTPGRAQHWPAAQACLSGWLRWRSWHFCPRCQKAFWLGHCSARSLHIHELSQNVRARKQKVREADRKRREDEMREVSEGERRYEGEGRAGKVREDKMRQEEISAGKEIEGEIS